jgi:hypothetical protein
LGRVGQNQSGFLTLNLLVWQQQLPNSITLMP